jgi:hypothetical protein
MTSRNLLERILAGAAFALAFSAAQAAVIVSTDATHNMNCAAGVCTPTAKDAVINATDLANMLASSDVTLKTDSKAKNILIDAAFGWTSPHRLTLDAYQNIKVQQVVTVAGQGGLTLITNDGGTDGDYSFVSPGYITFWDTGSSLVINGASYALLNDIHTLANDIAANPSSNYALAKSYDATPDGTYAHAPVSTAYSGSFEGLGNTVNNLTVLSTSCAAHVGLFATLNGGGAIRDINLPNASVRDAAKCKYSELVGALVGDSSGTITGASVAGAVSSASGNVEIGGLVGSARNGPVVASHFTGTVSGHGKDKGTVGGLVGYLIGTVVQSSAHADVKNGRIAGGLVGDSEGTIDLSNAGGSVKGQIAGGLIGQNGGTIRQSFATANVFAQTGGGLVGDGGGYLVANYSTGAVTGVGSGSGSLGGFMGATYSGDIAEAYAAGRVIPNKTSCVGGFVGLNESNGYHWAYWDTTTTQQSGASCTSGEGITGLTDAQLKSGLPSGFDHAAWGQDPNINNGWPYLLANPPQ